MAMLAPARTANRQKQKYGTGIVLVRVLSLVIPLCDVLFITYFCTATAPLPRVQHSVQVSEAQHTMEGLMEVIMGLES